MRPQGAGSQSPVRIVSQPFGLYVPPLRQPYLAALKKKRMEPAKRVDRPFSFYSGLDRPLGVQAHSLLEFLEAVKRVEVGSLEFHTERGDFERWIREVLGLAFLSSRISSLRKEGVRGERLREKLVEALEEWLKVYTYKRV